MFEAIEAGFPHLIRALRRACNLTHMEAVAAIYAHRYGDGSGPEAVCHAGGACSVIRRAIKTRGYIRTLRPER